MMTTTTATMIYIFSDTDMLHQASENFVGGCNFVQFKQEQVIIIDSVQIFS